LTLKLGKLPYEHDERTIDLGAFLDVSYVPEKYDFDKGRAAFPNGVWGNHKWQNCVTVAQAHCLTRLRRIETRRSSAMNEADVVKHYLTLTDSKRPGDVRDKGLSVLRMLKHWQRRGFTKPSWMYFHKIAVYGELDPLDQAQLRQACYLLGGVFLGLALPLAAQEQYQLGRWEVPLDTDRAAYLPGTWGEHLVFAKRYDLDNFYVLTWGNEIQVSNDFIKRYCDEAWAVVNDMARWKHDNGLDIQRLLARMPQPKLKGG
jgi:hypothetical protein